MCKPAVSSESLKLSLRRRKPRIRQSAGPLSAGPKKDKSDKQLLAELGHILTLLGAPDNVLKQVDAAIQGGPLPYKSLLPFAMHGNAIQSAPAPQESIESIINDEELAFLERQLFDNKQD